jgi:hypothetical protein
MHIIAQCAFIFVQQLILTISYSLLFCECVDWREGLAAALLHAQYINSSRFFHRRKSSVSNFAGTFLVVPLFHGTCAGGSSVQSTEQKYCSVSYRMLVPLIYGRKSVHPTEFPLYSGHTCSVNERINQKCSGKITAGTFSVN